MRSHLTGEEFKALFRSGHGRAYIRAAKDPSVLDAEFLYKACSRNNLFLGEDSRDFYNSQFLDLFPGRQAVLERIWRRLVRTPQRSEFGSDQFEMRWLATRYAERGDVLARNALYSRVNKNLREGRLDGAENLMIVDREKALHHLLAVLDSDFSPIPIEELQSMGYLIKRAFGEEWRDAWVKENAGRSRTATAIQESSRSEPAAKQPRTVIRTCEELHAAISAGDGWRDVVGQFVKYASREEYEKAARKLPESEDDLQHYLRVLFAYHPWPIELQPLFALTQHKKWKIVRAAYRALEAVESEEAREFALKRLYRRHEDILAVDVIVKNYRPGDEELIRKRATKKCTPREFHQFMIALRNIVESHPEVDHSYVTFLYEKMNCSYCRYSVVKLMIERGLVTDEAREECLHDAAKDTRLLFCEPTA